MMVASMPMRSPTTRSIPASDRAAPRNKLPPPSTTPSSMPASTAPFICRQKCPNTAGSIPWPASPPKASPLSFSSNRGNALFADCELRGNLCSKVRFFDFDTFPYLVAHKLHDVGIGLFHQRANLRVTVFYEWLVKQANFR